MSKFSFLFECIVENSLHYEDCLQYENCVCHIIDHEIDLTERYMSFKQMNILGKVIVAIFNPNMAVTHRYFSERLKSLRENEKMLGGWS